MIEPKAISTKSAIWDLHIHSNQCPKANKELSKITIPEYVDELIDLLCKYPDLEMISFTDHNHICPDLYEEFQSRECGIAIVPGIEIDMCLENDGVSKHLVVYFDSSPLDTDFRPLCDSINSIVAKHQVSSGNPIGIHQLLSELLNLKRRFVVSPHAFKQGKRAIDWDWHVDGGDAPNVDTFLDQFFAFWETSGASQIAHVVEYLRAIDRNEKESIVAFSDSKDFKKLKAYLDQPHQYFDSLPNFSGIQMVGSELTRIRSNQFFVPDSEQGKYLGSVHIGGQQLQLSPKLNAIIGGRGSGKSVLLDRIALSLNSSRFDDLIETDRFKFLETEIPVISSMSNVELGDGSFQFEYFNQSYVSSLFQSKGEAFNKQLEVYFGSAFGQIEEIKTESIRSGYGSKFNEMLLGLEPESQDNLIDFVGKYGVDRDEKLSIKFDKAPSATEAKKYTSIDYAAMMAKIEASFERDVPEVIRSEEAILEALRNYKKTVIEAARAARLGYINDGYLHRSLEEKLKSKRSQISKASKARQEAIDSFQSIFKSETLVAKRRTALIRAYFSMHEDMTLNYENQGFADGETPNAFMFKKELIVQDPLSYLIAVLDDCLLSEVGGNARCNPANIFDYIDAFRFGDGRYKSGKSADILEQKLKNFSLHYEEKSSIWYRKNPDSAYEDISTKSPGTRTNILLEYIVHRNTNVPLLIDQPEDNVDNQTIYGQIKKWFVDLKSARQVIVVTHDANIVINADAENVIVATQKDDGSFYYRFGALEYSDVLDIASEILDGGVDAVKRRLMKYGG